MVLSILLHVWKANANILGSEEEGKLGSSQKNELQIGIKDDLFSS